jgi:hypothetical protein
VYPKSAGSIASTKRRHVSGISLHLPRHLLFLLLLALYSIGFFHRRSHSRTFYAYEVRNAKFLLEEIRDLNGATRCKSTFKWLSLVRECVFVVFLHHGFMLQKIA